MILKIMIFLIIVSTLLNIIFLLKTSKFKNYKSINYLKEKFNKNYAKLLYEYWKSEIIIISIGITLSFISFFIDINNKVVLSTFIILSVLYSFIAITFGIYNCNSRCSKCNSFTFCKCKLWGIYLLYGVSYTKKMQCK